MKKKNEEQLQIQMKQMREQIKLKKKQMIDELATLRAQHQISKEKQPAFSSLQNPVKAHSRMVVQVTQELSTKSGMDNQRRSMVDQKQLKVLRNTAMVKRDNSTLQPTTKRDKFETLNENQQIKVSKINKEDMDDICNMSSTRAIDLQKYEVDSN